jgi:hypothetical protein
MEGIPPEILAAHEGDQGSLMDEKKYTVLPAHYKFVS